MHNLLLCISTCLSAFCDTHDQKKQKRSWASSPVSANRTKPDQTGPDRTHTYRVANQILHIASLILLGLAADVVKCEEEVVSVRQLGWELDLHLLIEIWRPEQ